MKILLHSSKTMKAAPSVVHALTTPQFIDQAAHLNAVLRDMSKGELVTLMGVSEALASSVKERTHKWNDSSKGSAAALTFRGDIYSGLSAAQWDEADATFAQKSLLIMSGLYGLLRPFDEIKPYRLEMSYRLKLSNGLSLDKFWKEQLASKLDTTETYINLTAREYFKVIEEQLSNSTVISPSFLTVSEKTNLPIFVTVHAKIARGSFANWLIKEEIDEPGKIAMYNQLNYEYDADLSTESEPVFVCRRFGGLGLSIRLK